MAAGACMRFSAVLFAACPAFAADLYLRHSSSPRHVGNLLESGRPAVKTAQATGGGGRGDSEVDPVAALATEEDPAESGQAEESDASAAPDELEEGSAAEGSASGEDAAPASGGAAEEGETAGETSEAAPDDGDESPAEERASEAHEEASAEHVKDSKNDKWFTIWYWKPFVISIGFMTCMVDLVGPLYNKCVKFSLQSEVVLLMVTIFGWTFLVFYFSVPGAAGVVILLAYASIACTLTLLVGILTLSMTLRGIKNDDPVAEIFTDIAKLFRFFLRVVMVVVILTVITTEAAVDWGQLAMLLGFMMLGIALSLSGVIGDIMAHIFLRMDRHFHEGDYIIFEDDLVQIETFGWRHTTGVKDSNAAFIYIPNSMLTGASLVNQSQDNDRVVEVDIPVDMDAEKIEQALKNCRSVFDLSKDPDFEFVGPDGEVYNNQFNTDECDVYLNATCDAVHITFVGLYFFSRPLDEEAAKEVAISGEGEDHQMDWEMAWYFQIQWFHIECKRRNEALGMWPYLDSWGPAWSRQAAE